jgi:hypothetical protein
LSLRSILGNDLLPPLTTELPTEIKTAVIFFELLQAAMILFPALFIHYSRRTPGSPPF